MLDDHFAALHAILGTLRGVTHGVVPAINQRLREVWREVDDNRSPMLFRRFAGHITLGRTMRLAIPPLEAAPRRLLALHGHCGPLVAWCALRTYRRRVSAERIIRSTEHTDEYGVFTIAMATALHQHGLRISFHSEPDPTPKPIERSHYQIARREGISIDQPLSLEDLLACLERGHLPIVFYDTPSGEGHFSPLVGEKGGKLLLPYSENGRMTRSELEAARSGDEILRQSIVVYGRRENAT